MIGRNVALAKEGIQAAKASWKSLEGGGVRLTTEAVTGFSASTGAERPVLEGEIDGVAVEVHITTDVVHWALTEVSAPQAHSEGKVAIYPSPGGLLSNLRDWLRDDIEIGDAELDPAFLITGTPPSAAKTLLANEGVRQRLCALPPGKLGAFTLNDKGIVVSLVGVVADAEIVQQALDLAVAAARATR
jgi:hypothetical protein